MKLAQEANGAVAVVTVKAEAAPDNSLANQIVAVGELFDRAPPCNSSTTCA
jgi:hypothetical protein